MDSERGTSGDLGHTRQSRYRCSLPGLAGFAGPRCTEPEVPRSGSRASRGCKEKSSIAPRARREREALANSVLCTQNDLKGWRNRCEHRQVRILVLRLAYLEAALRTD